MSENKTENVKSIQEKFDVDDARKQAPLFFVDEDEKIIYLASAKDWFMEPETSNFYPFPLRLKVDRNSMNSKSPKRLLRFQPQEMKRKTY